MKSLPLILKRASCVAILLAFVGTAAPAAAAPPEPLDYVALGDSYASGFGAGQYVNACGQSPLGLPSILDAKKQVELVGKGTCAGARAANIPGGIPDLPAQVTALSVSGALGPQTDLVTVSAGGNDVDFGTVVAVCATQPLAACEQIVAAKEALSGSAVATSLDALYSSIRAAAPHAHVVVTGYPHLFSPEYGQPGPLSAGAQQLFNDGTDALNSVIAERVATNGFQYVDVVQKFEDHGIGSPDPWITFTGFTAIDDLHPTAEGYKNGYFPAVRSNVNLAQLQR